MQSQYLATERILLRINRRVFVDMHSNERLPESFLEAVAVNFESIGYAMTNRLRESLRTLTAQQLAQLQTRVWDTLLENVGGKQKHVPLFRKFPDDIPSDMHDLWRKRVLTHYLQYPDQACLHCGEFGETHVLSPCEHIVCANCFDGSNYSACPICGQQLQLASPFLKPTDVRSHPNEPVTLALLDLCDDIVTEARVLFSSYCLRKQAMSPVDKENLIAIVRDFGMAVLPWVPEKIAVRENIAILFGTLLQVSDANAVLQAASQHVGTATDVLRLIAVYSGADAGLQDQIAMKWRNVEELRNHRVYGEWYAKFGMHTKQERIQLPSKIKRFKVAKLSRSLRKALLAFMEKMHPDSLTEDMLRHRSFWIWIGEFLHPSEYRNRFPQVASAFDIVRKKYPDGTPAPAFAGFYSRVEAAVRTRDVCTLLALLRSRPGEFARRLDQLLRLAADDSVATSQVQKTFTDLIKQVSTPVLLTLHALLPVRTRVSRKRIFWPSGSVLSGVLAEEKRAPFTQETVAPLLPTIEAELLLRFARNAHHPQFVVDASLKYIIAPFNEKTASKSAISLPRGSTIDVPAEKSVRLFLHWCEPERGGHRTDLDLSVGFYDKKWQLVGECSYYRLRFSAGSDVIATSSGDLTSAPFPDGSSEFVDLDCDAAERNGIRYAVVVLNNYSGLAFQQLERAYAGVMFRSDSSGAHFDPRSVKLKFNLQGANGVFMPLVLDLQSHQLHWLDVYSQGGFAFNNVANSNKAITAICPAMIDYFDSGVRTSMYELALLHAAARGNRIVIRRYKDVIKFERLDREVDSEFLKRVRSGVGGVVDAAVGDVDAEAFAILNRGDIELPDSCHRYVLQAERSVGNVAASDLIA